MSTKNFELNSNCAGYWIVIWYTQSRNCRKTGQNSWSLSAFLVQCASRALNWCPNNTKSFSKSASNPYAFIFLGLPQSCDNIYRAKAVQDWRVAMFGPSRHYNARVRLFRPKLKYKKYSNWLRNYVCAAQYVRKMLKPLGTVQGNEPFAVGNCSIK